MDAVRAVLPPKEWLAGSSWSYASTSTITPPTPSNRSVAPISSGETSCTDRAKKSRLSCMPLRVIAQKCREESRRDERPRDAERAAGGDGELNARRVGDDPRF